MSDEQDQSEALDDEQLADDQPTNDDRFVELPAEENYPPDEAQGVEDPGVLEIEDDLESRTRREQDDSALDNLDDLDGSA